ncbi:MAG: methanogenesis marker protein 6 [Methanobrevibacter sp.]|jgi:putative methanogenesis marker protein 6|nr:methanogenesis marker protein 6 [Methanobrevibacter sp.]
MIVLGLKAELSKNELFDYVHLLDLPVTVKITDYGFMVSGKEEEVLKIVKELRKLDPHNIFSRERGFPIGDPRRCREHRFGSQLFSREKTSSIEDSVSHIFGPREGFHQVESEYKLLVHVSDALRNQGKVYLKKEEGMLMNLKKYLKVLKF